MAEIKINTAELVKTDYKAPVQLLKILGEDNPVLQEVLPPFDFANPPVNPNEFASALVETCKENRGLGLAANQCGFRHRVFVMGAGEEFVAHFNPEIIAMTPEEEIGIEGCLSFPLLNLNVLRPRGIKVKYQDFNGEFKEATYEGLSARIFVHEYDHLMGVVFTQRTKPLALQSGIKKRNKMISNMMKNFRPQKVQKKNHKHGPSGF